MSTLSPEELASMAYHAGFRGEDLVQIVAIMGRESGGVSDAHRTSLANKSAPSGDIGLTQINHANLAFLQGKGIIKNYFDLTDPLTNLRAAYALYQNAGYRFTPWAAVAGKGWSAGGNPLAGVNMNVARQAVADANAHGFFREANGTLSTPGQEPLPTTAQASPTANAPTEQAGQPAGGDRLDPRFKVPLMKMLAAAKAAGVDLRLGEGYRSPQQEEADFRRKYVIDDAKGTITWQGHKWRHVSGLPGVPPGMGFHGAGLAADMVGDLNWMHAHIGEFGLQDFKDVNNDPVHIQLASLPRSWAAYRRSSMYYHSDNSAYDQANGFGGLPDGQSAGLNAALGGPGAASGGAAGGAAGSPAGGAPGSASSGVPPSAVAGTGPGGAITDNDLNTYVRTYYGFMAGFLDIPEIRTLLFDAARKGMGSAELQGALSQTQWWQTTSASSRNWLSLVSQDPAAAAAQVQATMSEIGDQAGKYGIRLSQEQLMSFATDANKYGWSGTQTIDNILRNVDFGPNGNVGPGALTASVDDLKATGSQYMIPVSDQSAQDYATRIARGELTKDGVVSTFRTQAKARYSYMSDLIDQGITPSDYFGPSRDSIARELEINPSTINMTDPKWMGMLEVPGSNGVNRAATFNEARLSARKLPEWAQTKGASDLAANMVQGLAQAWGAR